MNVRVGTVTAVNDRYLTVKLYHTNQVIENVVKTSPLNLDEREQQPNIKIGTETLVIEDDYGVTYALSSLSQGIELIKQGISRVENDELQFYGKIIKLMLATGDNVDTVEKIAEKVDIWTQKITIHNGSDDIIQILLDFMDVVSSQKAVVTSGSSVGNWGHDKTGAISALKAKLQAFKV